MLDANLTLDAIYVAVFAAMAAVIASQFVQGGRNTVLEQTILLDAFGPASTFRGTLEVEEEQPGKYLRLGSSSEEARRLRKWYRWIAGWGPQAKFDEVAFDGPRGVVEMREQGKITPAIFSQFSALRMKEMSGGHGQGAYWHLELVGRDGKATRFVTSSAAGRKEAFAQTAPLAKAIAGITGLPVEVMLARVWTPGWPPKERAAA